MNDDQKKPETTESPADELARLRRVRIERESKRDAENAVARELEKERLLARFEGELGARGSEWEILDTHIAGDPFVVVRRPAMVQWTKFEQSKQTPTDRYDLVAPSIAHPSLEQFGELRQKRVGIELTITNLMSPMMGIFSAEDAGK